MKRLLAACRFQVRIRRIVGPGEGSEVFDMPFCPHCGTSGVGLLRKLCLGHTEPAVCTACGGKCIMPLGAFLAVVPFSVALLFATMFLDRLGLTRALLIVGGALLLAVVLNLFCFPLVPYESVDRWKARFLSFFVGIMIGASAVPFGFAIARYEKNRRAEPAAMASPSESRSREGKESVHPQAHSIEESPNQCPKRRLR